MIFTIEFIELFFSALMGLAPGIIIEELRFSHEKKLEEDRNWDSQSTKHTP
jgi:hypothetical protein